MIWEVIFCCISGRASVVDEILKLLLHKLMREVGDYFQFSHSYHNRFLCRSIFSQFGVYNIGNAWFVVA